MKSFSIKQEHAKRLSDVKPLHITAPLPLQFLQTAFCIPGLFVISAAITFGVQIVGPVALIRATAPRQTRHFRLEGLVSSSCITDGALEHLKIIRKGNSVKCCWKGTSNTTKR